MVELSKHHTLFVDAAQRTSGNCNDGTVLCHRDIDTQSTPFAASGRYLLSKQHECHCLGISRGTNGSLSTGEGEAYKVAWDAFICWRATLPLPLVWPSCPDGGVAHPSTKQVLVSVEGMASRWRHVPKKRWRDLAASDLNARKAEWNWYELAQERKEWRFLCERPPASHPQRLCIYKCIHLWSKFCTGMPFGCRRGTERPMML